MKALIFGANGQDGHYLAEVCRHRGIEAVGISRSGGNWLQGDVSSFNFVRDIVHAHTPDLIFHFAATSTTRHEALFDHHNTIGGGTLNILESARLSAPECRVFITGSGLQFVNRGEPISEHDQFGHSSIYAAARNYGTYLARYYRGFGLRTYVGYLFHHESPLRGSHHVSQKIIQAVRRISQGSNEIIELGDTSVRKEWTFAGEVVEGVMTLVSQDVVSEATIGSGRSHSIEEWLQACFSLINKDWRDHVKGKEHFQSEYPLLVSNPATINSLGWRAAMPLSELAEMMFRASASMSQSQC